MQKTPLILLLALCASPAGMAQFYNDYELEPHGYFSKDAKDPATILMKRVQRGEVLVTEANGKPMVERLLMELDLNKATQVLVFSKTSVSTPRPCSRSRDGKARSVVGVPPFPKHCRGSPEVQDH